MNCPDCDRAIPDGAERCPRCGALARAPRPGGSAILRPRDDAPDAYPETPLIDHDHAIRRLRAAWRSAHVGYGQLVSLVGENGSGRSRLIRELGATIDEESPQARWLVGQAFSQATYRPYALLADLLAPWAGDDADEREPGARLATALERLAKGAPTADRWSLLAFAGEVRAGEAGGDLPMGALAEALARALGRAADNQPLVLILEDLEWADAASLALLDALLPKLTAGHTLALCTHHGDWSHDWPEIARHAQLFLGALPHADSLRLIRTVAGDRPLGASAEALAFAAGGNPLLLEQATLATLERPEVAGAPVPATLTDAVRARIAALPPDARAVLLAAAAIGPRLSYRAVAMVTEATLPDRRAIDAALRELTRRRLLLRWAGGPEVRYRFAHALIQEIAYAAIERAQLAALEARVADWLLSESALRGRATERVAGDLDGRAAWRPAEADADRVVRAAPTSLDLRRRAPVLARIVLADLSADQRASLAFCLQHGYSYDEAGELLGVGGAEVREHLYQARKLFKRLYEASALAPEAGAAGEPR